MIGKSCLGDTDERFRFVSSEKMEGLSLWVLVVVWDGMDEGKVGLVYGV